MPEDQSEQYIGDGCYAFYNGWDIRLRAPRDDGDHVIYLEPALMLALIAFAQKVGMIEVHGKAEAH